MFTESNCSLPQVDGGGGYDNSYTGGAMLPPRIPITVTCIAGYESVISSVSCVLNADGSAYELDAVPQCVGKG